MLLLVHLFSFLFAAAFWPLGGAYLASLELIAPAPFPLFPIARFDRSLETALSPFSHNFPFVDPF